MYIYVWIYVYIYIYICLWICVYIYIYTHICIPLFIPVGVNRDSARVTHPLRFAEVTMLMLYVMLKQLLLPRMSHQVVKSLTVISYNVHVIVYAEMLRPVQDFTERNP